MVRTGVALQVSCDMHLNKVDGPRALSIHFASPALTFCYTLRSGASPLFVLRSILLREGRINHTSKLAILRV
jgi:hypothetical protein